MCFKQQGEERLICVMGAEEIGYQRVERRKSPRANAKIPLRLKVSGRGALLEGHTVDISKEGAFVCIDPPPKVGEILHIELELVDIGETIKAIAEVVRIGSSAAAVGVGIRFMGFSHGDSAHIEQVVLNELSKDIS